MAVPGLTPRFPVTTVGPLLVTVEPAKTPKELTVGPRLIWAFRQRENVDQKRNAVSLFTALPFIQSLRFKLPDVELYNGSALVSMGIGENLRERKRNRV
jgi:hypothetical protein